MRSRTTTDPLPNAGPTIYHFSRPRIVALVILGPAIVLSSLLAALLELLFLMLFAITLNGHHLPATGFWIRVASSGFLFMTCLPKLFDTRPALVVADDYLEDNSGVASYGHIPWDEVYDIRPATIGCFQGVSIFTNVPRKGTRTAGRIARGLRRRFESFFGSPVQIVADCMSESPGELMLKLNERFERHLNQTEATRKMRGMFVRGTAYAPREEYLAPYVENPAARG